MHVSHACRTNSAILEATEDTPDHTRLSAASSPRGCWVSVYDAGYISAGPCLAMYMYNVCCNCMDIIAVARAENYIGE